MADLIFTIIGYLIPLVLLLVTFFTGNYIEKKHYQNIIQREKALRKILVVPVKRPPEDFIEQQLVLGSVVVSSDYFRRFLAFFRNLFGGSIRSYETLLDRARREAVLRMKEQAAELGADIVFNMKFETSTLGDIHNPRDSGAVGTVEVLVYGTAGKLKRRQAA